MVIHINLLILIQFLTKCINLSVFIDILSITVNSKISYNILCMLFVTQYLSMIYFIHFIPKLLISSSHIN